MNDTTARDFATDIEARIERLIRAHRSLSNVLLGAGFVVVSAHGLSMRYTIDNGMAGDPVQCSADRASRFTRDDAIRVAASTHDGTGKPFTAVHVREAVERELKDLQEVLDLLRSRAAAVADEPQT